MRPVRTVRILCAALLAFCIGALLPLHHHHDHGDELAAAAGVEAHEHAGHEHDHDSHDHAPGEPWRHADCPVCQLARTLTLQAFVAPPVAGPEVVELGRAAEPQRPAFPQVIRVYDGRGPPAC